MSGLQLHGVRKSFGAVDVIHGVDLTAERGVAMVFQSYALYPHMTVAENMGFGLRMNGMAATEIDTRVDRAAGILHLEQLLDRRPKQLSGGQRQRVAIGRAIVREPEVFLFDEPLSNLDAELRVQMRLEIAKLHQDLAATMIYVTHDQVEAMTLADKIVVLRAGRVEQIGSPRMNFLRGVAAGVEGGRVDVALTDFDGAVVPFTLSNGQVAPGAELVVGIRPEHFSPDGAVRISTPIDVVEDLGGASYAYARSDEAQPLTIEFKGDRRAQAGSVLTTGFAPEKAFLFEPGSEQRLR